MPVAWKFHAQATQPLCNHKTLSDQNRTTWKHHAINTHTEFYVWQVHYHVDNLLSSLPLTIVPAIIKVFHSFFCIFFIAKFDIDIANKMVSKVITHIHFFNFTILKQQQQAKLTFGAYKGLISTPLNFWQGGGNVVLQDSKYCTLLAFKGTSLNYCLNNLAIHSLVLVIINLLTEACLLSRAVWNKI